MGPPADGHTYVPRMSLNSYLCSMLRLNLSCSLIEGILHDLLRLALCGWERLVVPVASWWRGMGLHLGGWWRARCGLWARSDWRAHQRSRAWRWRCSWAQTAAGQVR